MKQYHKNKRAILTNVSTIANIIFDFVQMFIKQNFICKTMQ